jgi:hypothetical protein
LGADVPDDPAERNRLTRFYESVSREEFARASVVSPFADDTGRMEGRYVGARSCAGCHGAEYEQWVATPHASAYKTLLEKHRHSQPRCVSCHVVGFGAKHGYRLGDPEEPLANVQCEVCHGPGRMHVEHPSAQNIRRSVPQPVCLSCHNPEHSDHFDYAVKLPLVRHGPRMAMGASGRPAMRGR